MMMAKIDPTLPHYEVRKFLAGRPNGNADTDGRIAELLGWPVGPAYSTDLNAVVGQLSKTGWWWHLSHIEATVIPTRDADGPLKGLVSNGARYDREGNPIEYVDAFAKGRPAMALCSAAIRATYDLPEALHVVASHSAHVLSKKPQSTEHRMAYYRAREHYRLEAIAAWEAENPQ